MIAQTAKSERAAMMCTLLMCCTTRVISEACATMTNMVKACGIIRLAERMPLEATLVAWVLTFLRSTHKAIRMTPARAKTIVLVAIVVLSSPVREFPSINICTPAFLGMRLDTGTAGGLQV